MLRDCTLVVLLTDSITKIEQMEETANVDCSVMSIVIDMKWSGSMVKDLDPIKFNLVMSDCSIPALADLALVANPPTHE